jgi:hypothetical protein
VSGWHQELDDMMGRLELEEEPAAMESESQPVEHESEKADQEVEIDLTAFEARIGQEMAENYIMPDR